MYVVCMLYFYCGAMSTVRAASAKRKSAKYVSMFGLSVCRLYVCIMYSVCMHVRMYVVCMYYVRCERKDVCILPGARSLTVVCGSLVRSPWGDVCSVCVYVGCAYVCSM